MKPTVLLAMTTRWIPTVRLAMALKTAGFTVDALCLPGHPLEKTEAARKAYPYNSLAPLRSFASAITACKPDLILPGDDLATMQLHALYEREFNRGGKAAPICCVIERSLGSPSSFSQVYARAGLLEIAREEDIRAPKTEVLTNVNQLREWGAHRGFPAVLKSNGSSGGEGVRIVHTQERAERAFRTLQAPPLLARAVKRALVDGDKTLILPSLLRRRSEINIQEYVPGREATSIVACWQGTLLAGMHFEVLSKTNPTGPASVMRLIDSDEMSIVAEKIVRRLNLSGLVGFDFMLEEQTGDPYLIEVNPRATQVGHLTLGPGRDLPAALYAALTGEEIREAPNATENRTIALFPQEWKRNPDSPFLQSGYHDVPWEEPELIRSVVHGTGKQLQRTFDKERVRAFSPVRLPNR